MSVPQSIKTISEYHRLNGLPQPKHPLISLIRFDDAFKFVEEGERSYLFSYYIIALKKGMNAKYRYGQQDYDFDEGVMFFVAPNQIFGIQIKENYHRPSGWMLLIHPDFLWNTALAKRIREYDFFSYAAHEALFLSDDEEFKIQQIISNIEQEYQDNIDQFSQGIIISQIDTLLSYSDRFYNRQFITRQKGHHQILEQVESLLDNLVNSDSLLKNGLPSVQWVSNQLNVSPNYLRKLLNEITGKSTQQIIHEKLIEKAKEKLSTTKLSVSEIAYELGFEHPQSLSKLFKSKTNLSPSEFRQSFN